MHSSLDTDFEKFIYKLFIFITNFNNWVMVKTFYKIPLSFCLEFYQKLMRDIGFSPCRRIPTAYYKVSVTLFQMLFQVFTQRHMFCDRYMSSIYTAKNRAWKNNSSLILVVSKNNVKIFKIIIIIILSHKNIL